MDCLDVINTIARAVAAVGSIIVAVLAIWGEWFRARIVGPKLDLALRDSRGNLTSRADGRRTIYYHLEVRNRRKWSPANHVRILVTGIEKKRPDGEFSRESLIAPLQLNWAFAAFHEQFPTIATQDVCDLGFLDEAAQRFSLSLYVVPNNFTGYVAPGESMRVSVVASGHNYESKSPLVLEIAWDGKWTGDMEEMGRHLVVKQV